MSVTNALQLYNSAPAGTQQPWASVGVSTLAYDARIVAAIQPPQ